MKSMNLVTCFTINHVGRKKARRYMTDMGIDPIYPKMNLSKRAHNSHILPYLLKHVDITRPNHAWSIDYPDDYVIPVFYTVSRIQTTTAQKYRDNFFVKMYRSAMSEYMRCNIII